MVIIWYIECQLLSQEYNNTTPGAQEQLPQGSMSLSCRAFELVHVTEDFYMWSSHPPPEVCSVGLHG